MKKITQYVDRWKKQGYPDDIPDEVPMVLADNNLAPSYRQIAIAILNNDFHFSSLGFSRPKSEWYSRLKKIEIEERNKMGVRTAHQDIFKKKQPPNMPPDLSRFRCYTKPLKGEKDV